MWWGKVNNTVGMLRVAAVGLCACEGLPGGGGQQGRQVLLTWAVRHYEGWTSWSIF